MRRTTSKLLILCSIFIIGVFTLLGVPVLAQRNNKTPIKYQGGPLVTRTANIYLIWYGEWAGNNAPNILVDFIVSLSGSPYYNINTTYYDASGAPASNGLVYGGSVGDLYSRGPSLSESDIQEVIAASVLNAQLPLDPNGIYLVLTSADVSVAGFCTDRCEFHDHFNILGTPVRYAFVGNADRCPYECAGQFTNQGNLLPTPNGNLGADAMASWTAHVLSGIVTNPEGKGWLDEQGQENSDRCQSTFGRTYSTANGARANMRIIYGNRDFLIQQNWVNADQGYCAMSYPDFVKTDIPGFDLSK
jgi:hypothetical protein